MNLIHFPEVVVVIAKDQPEYLPLPAWRRRNDPFGRVVCCWKLSWKERLKILFSGLIWHEIFTFNKALQPQLLTLEKPDMPPSAVKP